MRIGFRQLNYDDLCVLIGPDLYRLHIDIDHEQPSINFAYLGSLIMSLTTKLKQFNFDYQGIGISINDIRTAHTLFRNIQSIETHLCDTLSLVCRDMI